MGKVVKAGIYLRVSRLPRQHWKTSVVHIMCTRVRRVQMASSVFLLMNSLVAGVRRAPTGAACEHLLPSWCCCLEGLGGAGLLEKVCP